MRTNTIRAVLVFASAALVAGWDHVDEPGFIRAVGGHNLALVAYSAASQALESEWLKISESEETLSSVDCSILPQLCKDYDIISYPTIRYFDGHGTMTPYRGPRIAKSIISFLRRAGRPATTHLDDKTITAFQSIDDAVVVAHINARDAHVRTLFQSLAHRYRDRASFGQLETGGPSTVVCYNNRDDEQSTTSDLSAVDTLAAFVEACITPLVGEFSRRTEVKYAQSGKSLVYYLAETREERDRYVDLIRPVAKKYRDFISFVVVDAVEYAPMTRILGLPGDSFPALAVENLSRGQIFPFDEAEQDITADAVDQFIVDIAGGKVRPWAPRPPPVSEPIGHAHDEL
ncbi:thioredoxin-like domain-containing protein [Pestalotiopsis sp. NC0098]|nr:thioredoxin-like domain-containing protein [Pestalotiopsis sp. NC0098]